MNLTRADLVREIHADYVAAGVDFIETNTFGANRPRLNKFGLGDKTREIAAAGARLAREAADGATGDTPLVMGALGPLGIEIEPMGTASREEVAAFYREPMEALLEGGVDGFILETFTSIDEIGVAIALARELAPGMLVVAQMTTGEDGSTVYGVAPERFAPRLLDRGADIVGVNCSIGPNAMADVLRRIRAVVSAPVSVQPNAGVPRNVDGRNLYLCSPEYMGEYAKRFIQEGANVIGGCCGTGPEHIRAMRGAIRAQTAAERSVVDERIFGAARADEEPSVEIVALAERSAFGRALAEGGFPVSVELSPPRGHLMGRLLKKAKALQAMGVSAINIPDGPRATARMSPMATGVRIQGEADIDVIMHYTCRDRNLLGMQSDLLGAFALGIRNLLLVTGDPPKMGTYPDATAVFDVDSSGLAHLVRRLNQGRDLGQTAIGKPTAFVYGVGVNPGALDLEHELTRLRQKLDAGAHYVITQPIFDPEAFKRFVDRLDREGLRGVPLLAGVWPLTSLANAEFLNGEVPGVTVPAGILDRMAAAADQEDALRRGASIASEMIAAVRPVVDGLQVSAPLGRVEMVRGVLEGS
jgi:methionine synthase / methylenetetrahydrofolate reductase(NADPH)